MPKMDDADKFQRKLSKRAEKAKQQQTALHVARFARDNINALGFDATLSIGAGEVALCFDIEAHRPTLRTERDSKDGP